MKFRSETGGLYNDETARRRRGVVEPRGVVWGVALATEVAEMNPSARMIWVLKSILL